MHVRASAWSTTSHSPSGADGDTQEGGHHLHRPPPSDALAGAYLRGAWNAQDLDVDAAVRHDAVVGDSSATTYRLGAAWWPLARLVRLHAATGTAFFAPSLDERYGFYPSPFGNFTGNPDLEPQTSGSWEGGVDLRPSRSLLLGATAFRTIYHRRITAVFDALGNGTLVNESSDSAIRGIESELAWDDPHLPFAIHGFLGDLAAHQGRWRHRLRAAAAAQGERRRGGARPWRLGAGGHRCGGGATRHRPHGHGRLRHPACAAVGWQAWRGITIYARAENLLDKGYTVDQYAGFDALGNPLGEFYYTGTPRSYFAGLEARF